MVETNRIRDMLDEASALLQAGHVQEAEATGRKVLILAPETARAHHLIGAIEMKNGRRDVAIEHFRKAVQLRPADAHYQNTLGAIYAEDRQPVRAIHHFWQALYRGRFQMSGARPVLRADRRTRLDKTKWPRHNT